MLGKDLGGCGGLWRREFQKGLVMGSRWSFRWTQMKCGVVLLWEGSEGVAGSSGEIGGWISGCSGGVSGSGLLRKGEVEGLQFLVDF